MVMNRLIHIARLVRLGNLVIIAFTMAMIKYVVFEAFLKHAFSIHEEIQIQIYANDSNADLNFWLCSYQ